MMGLRYRKEDIVPTTIKRPLELIVASFPAPPRKGVPLSTNIPRESATFSLWATSVRTSYLPTKMSAGQYHFLFQQWKHLPRWASVVKLPLQTTQIFLPKSSIFFDLYPIPIFLILFLLSD